jgi:acetyl-CoA C-acetyltransferase
MLPVPDESRLPVVAGVGQLRANRERSTAGAREPLELVADALAAAERDAGVRGLLAAADSVYAVRIASWAYADLASTVAARVGARPRTCIDTVLGGHLPVRLLDEAAARIEAGESDVALVVGGEAQASVTALGKAGVDPVADLGWSAAPGGPPAFDPDVLGSPAMQASGLFVPARVYPLYENRLQADLGLTPEEAHAWSARLYADLSRVAATQPAAWNREPQTPEQIATVGPGNRMVCEPYPVSLNAMPHVDQAAAVVVTSLAVARARGVPESRLVHVWGGAGVDDVPDPLQRVGFSRSEALGQALDRCLDQASVGIGHVDHIDVYSCFPVVPKLASLHLGLDRTAVLSVAGGHSSFGGPLNSYSLHAIATMALRLREGAALGLVHANGGYLTSQHAVLLGTTAHPAGYVGRPEPTGVPAPDAPALLDATAVAQDGDGVALTVETLTVEHDRHHGPKQAFVVGRTARGDRVAAASHPDDRATAAALSQAALTEERNTHVGRTVRLSRREGGAVVTA